MASRRWSGFAVVGTIGFLIDAGILTLLMTRVGLDHYTARAISFSIAVSSTWYMNRRWVFDRQAVQISGREYTSYVVVQLIGATINLLVFVVAIELIVKLRNIPVIPLALGAGVALLFNYGASRRFVFADGRGNKTRGVSQ